MVKNGVFTGIWLISLSQITVVRHVKRANYAFITYVIGQCMLGNVPPLSGWGSVLF